MPDTPWHVGYTKKKKMILEGINHAVSIMIIMNVLLQKAHII